MKDPRESVRAAWKTASSSLGFYVVIETTWHVMLFTACYRYRPLAKLGNTAVGKRLMEQVQRLTPGGSASNLLKRVQGGNRSVVAASEWFFINKAIGIPLWPTKLLLAGWLSQKYEEYRKEQTELEEESRSFFLRAAESAEGANEEYLPWWLIYEQ